MEIEPDAFDAATPCFQIAESMLVAELQHEAADALKMYIIDRLHGLQSCGWRAKPKEDMPKDKSKQATDSSRESAAQDYFINSETVAVWYLRCLVKAVRGVGMCGHTQWSHQVLPTIAWT